MSERLQTCEIGHQDRLQPRQILVATMPRSGTWFNNIFYSSYFHILTGKMEMECVNSLLETDFRDDSGVNGYFRLSHMECPGFAHWAGSLRKAWNGLRYTAFADYGNLTMDPTSLETLDPSRNQEVRIVYCCRNPLDQAVSAFHHLQKHTRPELLNVEEKKDNVWLTRSIEDARDYLFSVGIDSYMKQLLSFRWMKKAYPDNLMLIKYEDLIRSPSLVFAKALEFMGHQVNCAARQRAFSMALQLSSMESVRSMERHLGHSIANDQVDPKASHIKDGAIGKWKRFFNQDDLQRVNERLAAFGMSLGEFTLD